MYKLYKAILRLLRIHYWACEHCNNIEYYEREIICWECGKGEMIYRG